MDDEFDGAGRSCYVLEFSVPPGGMRLGLLFAYPNLDYVYACLQQLLLADSELAEFNQEILEDEDVVLRLWVVQHEVVAHWVDLRPFLRTDGGSLLELDREAVTTITPPLEGRLIDAVGIRVRVEGTPVDGFTYLEEGISLAPGFNDMEGDEPPSEFEDPWRPRH